MDETTLRLVIELYEDDAGKTRVAIRRCDRPVAYGPVIAEDFHFLIEALLPDGEVAGVAGRASW